MAEEKSFKFDEAAFKAKVASFDKLRDTLAGKSSVNPYIWYRDNVQAKVTAYAKGDRSKELYDSLMAVKELTLPEVPKAEK